VPPDSGTDDATEEIGHAIGREVTMPPPDEQVDHIEDDVLRLIFLTCHPVLPPASRAALTLRLVGGLTTAEVARGFLVSEATMGQRISRAKAVPRTPTGAGSRRCTTCWRRRLPARWSR